MTDQLKLYLDVCCLNCPFDSWAQDRIRIEAEAVISILDHIEPTGWQLITSTALISEIAQTPNPDRRQKLMDLLRLATLNINVTPDIMQRARELQHLGFKPFDALHLSCAETANADVFLRTDDRLRRRANTMTEPMQLPVDNPLTWLINIHPNQPEE